jgi:rod shape-determining protein MreB
MTRPRVMVCIPTGATGAERRAVREAAQSAGAGKVELIEEPLAAALGVGLDITKANGHMVVDIGGGTTDVAVLTLGGMAASDSVRVGGDAMDAAIAHELRSAYSLAIGERTAEEVKIEVGSVHPDGRAATIDIRGRDLLTGMPRTLSLPSADVRPILMEPAHQVVDSVRRVLEDTPPELLADILDRGIWLTGGGSLLHGMPELISRETGLPAQRAEDPMTSVALGTARALDLELVGRHIVVFKRVI